MSADDFRAYLIQQGQGQAAMQRLADISRDPEREAADLAQTVEDTARDQIAHMAEQAESYDDDLVAMLGEVRDLRDGIEDRSLTVAEAKKALLELRQRRGANKSGVDGLRRRYDEARKTVKNPAARRDELITKYGL